jgi:hypothetical protein
MIKWLTKNDIPIEKLNNSEFTNFLEENMGRKLPSVTSMRSELKGLAMDQIKEIKKEIGNNNIWVQVDETTDSMGRYVGNVVVGIMSREVIWKSYLVNCVDLQGPANTKKIVQLIDDSIDLLFVGTEKRKRLLLLITDGANYMRSAGKTIHQLYPHYIHITCMAHLINRVVESIRCESKLANDLISSMKRLFTKCPQRIKIYKELAPDLQLPPKPIITRWGTWLEAAVFYAKNFETIEKIVEKLKDDDSSYVEKCKDMVKKAELKAELTFILTNYEFIVKLTNDIQKNGIKLNESIEIINEFELKIDQAKTGIGNKIIEKKDKIIEKNIGYGKIKKINNIISYSKTEEEIQKLYTLEQLSCFKFIPITSCEVERTFSRLKLILNDKRKSMEFENLRNLLIISYNK